MANIDATEYNNTCHVCPICSIKFAGQLLYSSTDDTWYCLICRTAFAWRNNKFFSISVVK